MRDFLKAEVFYLKRDSVLRTICIILLAASIVLALWIWSANGGWNMDNLLQPLGLVVSTSIFLYFIIPIHACFFSTEGFEYGTIKNIISSGENRTTYFIGKLYSEIKVIAWCLLQFYGVFVFIYYAAALISGAQIGNTGLMKQVLITIPAVFYNALYLTAYTSVIFMIGFIVRKTTIATILTFVFTFGDLLISGYLKDSPNLVLRMISQSSLMTQIFKFSGMYVVDSKKIMMTVPADYITAAVIPAAIIVISTLIALFVFTKKDIRTN